MAIFRCLHTEFWKDDYFLELTPEDKYFYIYLLTNDRCSQCGIYNLNAKFAALELGYSVDTVKTLLDRFMDYGKIIYNENTGEVMVLNWYKYNLNINNKNTRTCINTCLKKVKTLEFVKKFYSLCVKDNEKNISLVNEMFKDIKVNSIKEGGEDTTQHKTMEEVKEEVAISVEDKIEKKEGEEKFDNDQSLKEIELIKKEFGIVKNNNNSRVSSFEDVMKVLEKNFFKIDHRFFDLLKSWIFDITPDVIIKAIEIATLKNNKSVSYVNGILTNWYRAGVKDIESYKTIIEKKTSIKDKIGATPPSYRILPTLRYEDEEDF